MVVDCATPPIDKACGEGLMPDSLQALAGLGVAIPSHAGFAFRGIRFADAHSSVYADFPDGMGKGVQRSDSARTPVGKGRQFGCLLRFGIRSTSI